MLRRTYRNRIACDAATYWKYALTEDYNREWYEVTLGYRKFEWLHRDESAAEVRVRLRYAPPPPPGPLRKFAKMFGPAIAKSLLTEDLVFDKATQRASITYETSEFPDRMSVRATVDCQPLDGGAIDRVYECEIAMNMP